MYCSICKSTDHSTEAHPVCKICGSKDHTESFHNGTCSVCGSSDHTTSEHKVKQKSQNSKK